MDICVARTFLEVVKTGSFVNAAANLNITQTAVSARIRGLEEDLGRSLLIRSKAGACPTPEGQEFLRFARTLVHAWECARRAVALPSGRQTLVTVGAELCLWKPLLSDWLLWMHRECPQIAVGANIGKADLLIDQVHDGKLDIAVIHDARHCRGIATELLFDEKLVLARTTPVSGDCDTLDHVQIDWGEDFASSYQAAFPDKARTGISIGYGPLALRYILATGGCGYFPMGVIRPLIGQGRLSLVPESPEFSYPAYMVYSADADPDVIAPVRKGLRAAARSMAPAAPVADSK